MQRIWLAELHAHRGDPDRARQELLDMVAPGSAQIASAEHLAMAHVALGDLARHAGDLDEAAAQYDAAREHILTAPGAARFAHALVETAKGHLAVATGDPGSGRQHLAESLAVAVELPDMPLAAHAGIALARLLVRDGDARAAAEVLGASHLLRGGTDVLDADAAGLVVDLRETLGERAYHAAYAAGHSGNRDDALALLTSRTQRG
jgi:tetratricopeptide (TPR) repeat protein